MRALSEDCLSSKTKIFDYLWDILSSHYGQRFLDVSHISLLYYDILVRCLDNLPTAPALQRRALQPMGIPMAASLCLLSKEAVMHSLEELRMFQVEICRSKILIVL